MRTSAVEEGVEVSYREVKGLVDQLQGAVLLGHPVHEVLTHTDAAKKKAMRLGGEVRGWSKCEMRLKNLSATGGGCVGARVAGGSPGAATRSSRGMRVRLAPATLAGVSRNACGNRVGRAGRCDWSGTGHSPEELAIGDVRLKLDPLLVEASPAVDGERIHVLRRAHVPAGGEDQAWYGRKGKEARGQRRKATRTKSQKPGWRVFWEVF